MALMEVNQTQQVGKFTSSSNVKQKAKDIARNVLEAAGGQQDVGGLGDNIFS
jgi:hypothetical protein